MSLNSEHGYLGYWIASSNDFHTVLNKNSNNHPDLQYATEILRILKTWKLTILISLLGRWAWFRAKQLFAPTTLIAATTEKRTSILPKISIVCSCRGCFSFYFQQSNKKKKLPTIRTCVLVIHEFVVKINAFLNHRTKERSTSVLYVSSYLLSNDSRQEDEHFWLFSLRAKYKTLPLSIKYNARRHQITRY